MPAPQVATALTPTSKVTYIEIPRVMMHHVVLHNLTNFNHFLTRTVSKCPCDGYILEKIIKENSHSKLLKPKLKMTRLFNLFRLTSCNNQLLKLIDPPRQAVE